MGLAHTMAYQPLSVLKLIPHLYVMDKLDKDPGLDMLDQANGISWVRRRTSRTRSGVPARAARRRRTPRRFARP